MHGCVKARRCGKARHQGFRQGRFVQALYDLLQNPESAAPLDLAALEIAQIEYPDLDCGHYLKVIDGWAAELCDAGIESFRGENFIREFHGFFYDQLGLHGNTGDYYNPLNSCLNEVIDRRTGIPITMAVLYQELARRIGRDVRGVSFPGHFLVEVRDGVFQCFVDVFHRGRLMSKDDCLRMGRELTGIDYASRPELLEPVEARSILIRMLSNLRGIYITRRANRKLLAVLDLLLIATPGDADEFFSRAMVKMNLHMHASAERDLQQYLKLRPDADNKGEIEHQLQVARMLRSQMN
jgi:regulator of sirC expression with transglutaminase-like and TPR domain